MIRSKSIYVSRDNWVKLGILAKATQDKTSSLDTPVNRDSIANDVLTSYFEGQHPELDGYVKELDKAERQAVESVKQAYAQKIKHESDPEPAGE